MSFHRFIMLLVCIALSSACGPPAEEPDVVDGTDQGPGLLQPFKRQLQQALKAGMADGPEQAIEVCQLRAPEIARALSVEGVRVGRASHKLRNAANAGPEWVTRILRGYLQSDGERKPEKAALENGYIGYAEPIMVQPLCLTCHGEQIDPEIAARISELYPDDQATGFKLGDLRGVFWVEFPTHK